MRRILLAALCLGLFWSAHSVNATSGACSSHGGVSCSSGADWDGSVICNDGWRSSSVSYSSMAMCGGSSSYYNAPSTPSCPLMSYYDYLADSCKCMSGYVVQKDFLGNDACVSADSVCRDQLGIMSRYNSLSNTCECSYGYIIYNGQCTSKDNRCTGLFGYGAKYDLLQDECECRDGYSFDGARCSLDLNSTYPSYYSYTPPTPTTQITLDCPKNSSGSSDGQCYCNTNYRWSDARAGCVPTQCDSGYDFNANRTECLPILSCDAGFVRKNGLCITYSQDCQDTYGEQSNVMGTKGSDGYSFCSCQPGYTWNGAHDYCQKADSDSPITPSTESTKTTVTTPTSGPGTYQPEKRDQKLTDRLKGTILLQTESHGEAWYINPTDSKRYYMADGSVAYNMMRSFGLGITDKDLNAIPSVDDPATVKTKTTVCTANKLADSLRGKILLQVQQHGEAWYIHPDTCYRVYLKDGNAAYTIMRLLSLGISNTNLEKLPDGNLN